MTRDVCPGGIYQDKKDSMIVSSWEVFWVVVRPHHDDKDLLLCVPLVLVPDLLGELECGSLDVCITRPDGYVNSGILHRKHRDGLLCCGTQVWIHAEDLLSPRFEFIEPLEQQWIDAVLKRTVEILDGKLQPTDEQKGADEDPDHQEWQEALSSYALRLTQELRGE